MKILNAFFILIYVVVFMGKYTARDNQWIRKQAYKKGFIVKNQSELDIEQQLGLQQWAIANRIVDNSGNWLSFYTVIFCVAFAFGHMLIDELSWYFLFVPITFFSAVAMLISLLRWGFGGMGVRFGLMNLIVVAIVAGTLHVRGALQPPNFTGIGYYYRWLWSPAGGFGGAMIVFWLLMQPRQLFMIPGTAGLQIAGLRGFIWTAVLGAAWFQFGPYSKWYLIIVYGALCVGLFLRSFEMIIVEKPRKETIRRINGSIVFAALLMSIAFGVGCWLSANPDTLERLRPFQSALRETAPVYPSFWPSANRRNPAGFIETETGQPIRVVAVGPDIALFKTRSMVYPAEVISNMEPWRRYYAFERATVNIRGEETNVISVASEKTTPENQRAWVYENECYVITSNLGLQFTGPTSIYESAENARSRKKPAEQHYQWLPDSSRTGGIVRRPDVLPVVQDVDGSYRFVRPDGTQWGFPLYWVRGDDPNIVIRRIME